MQMDLNVSDAKIKELIENATHIAVVPSKVYGTNAFCAAVGLYHMLLDKQKEVYFIHVGKVPEIANDLIKGEDITSNVSQRELLVNIDYSNTPAAKVHYSTENDVLHLIVSPVPKDYDKDARVTSKITGFDFDLILTVGVQEMEDLGQTYRELEKEFNSSKVVNLDNTNKNQKFGIINVVDTSADTLSLLVLKKTSEWGLVLNTKAAKALLTGMTYKDAKIDS